MNTAGVKAAIDHLWAAVAINDLAKGSMLAADLCARHAPVLAPHVRQLIEQSGRRGAMACREALAILNALAPTPRPAMPIVAPVAKASKIRRADNSDTSIPTVEIDPEFARIWAALGYAAALRIWAVARETTVQARGGGVVDEAALIAGLMSAGCGSISHIRRILREGDGVFYRRSAGLVYLVSYEKLVKTALQRAISTGRAELVSTNLPGVQFVAVPYGGNLKRWRAWLYAGWLNSREGKTANISRYTLTHLFGVTKATLIGWERIAHIEIHTSYAHYTDSRYLPGDYAFPVVLSDGRGGMHVSAMARTSNRYEAPSMCQRQHRRLPRMANRAARSHFQSIAVSSTNHPSRIIGQPNADQSADGGGFKGFSRTGRRYFQTVNAHKGDPVVQSAKALRRHLVRHDEDAPHFAYVGRRGQRNPVTVYEQSIDGGLRAGIRLPRRVEDAYFAANGGRSCWIVAWRKVAA